MTAIITMDKMSTYEKQIMKEKSQKLTCTQCKICHKIIGGKKHVVFEERYFHVDCLKQATPATH